jgi:hypothetical protein
MYLKPALEMGIGGLALFLAICLLLMKAAVVTLRRARTLGLIGLGIAVALAVTGLTGPMLDAYPINLLVWATAGWLARTNYVQSAVVTEQHQMVRRHRPCE